MLVLLLLTSVPLLLLFDYSKGPCEAAAVEATADMQARQTDVSKAVESEVC